MDSLPLSHLETKPDVYPNAGEREPRSPDPKNEGDEDFPISDPVVYHLQYLGGHSLLQGIFWTQESNPVSCTAGRFFFTTSTTWDSLCIKRTFIYLYYFFGHVAQLADFSSPIKN